MTISQSNQFVNIKHFWLAAIVFLFCAAVVPVVSYSLIDHPPEYDELLHVLSARGVAESGQPVIEDGLYTRAEIYTRLVAGVRGLHTDELIASRLPALLFAMVLAGVIACWTTLRVGWLAGLVAGIVFAITPPTINLAVIVRFYTVHALVITLLIILVYEASLRSRNVKFLSLSVVIACLCIWLAFQLHDITQIAVGGLLAGIAALILYEKRNAYWPTFIRKPVLSIGLLSVAVILVMLVVWKLGLIDQLRKPPPVWSEVRSNHYAFYLGTLGSQMPFIWPLFPLMVVAAFTMQRRLSIFLIAVVLTDFVAHSIASQKATRYIYHFYPLICILWGVGFQQLVMFAADAFKKKTQLSYMLSSNLVLALAFVCIVSTQEFRSTLKLMLGRDQVSDVIALNQEPSFVKVQEIVSPLLPEIDRVIASSGFKALHAFDRYDYELHATVVAETDTREDFGIDHRTGKQVIGSADAISTVIDMDGAELIILENRMMNTSHGANVDAIRVIDDRCLQVDTPQDSGVSVWTC